jgi:argininosuccinate synthase
LSRNVRKVVLAYSGGLDTSIILKWLLEEYQCEVIAFAADLGQGDDLETVRQKALDTGASKVIIEDLREEFVRDYVFPAFRANAVYEGHYLLGTSLARPLIAKRQVAVAAAESADAVSHGATGKGNDQVRFELSYTALNPDLKIIAPWRQWQLKSRQDLLQFAGTHGIPVPVTPEKPYSMDGNLLHLSYEGGVLEDPWREPDPEMFRMTVAPEDAPDTPAYVEIDFEEGNPVAVDGDRLGCAELLARLNELGGASGIGRVDLVENRFVGIKSRGVYETPGGTILRMAHQAVESITMDREVLHLRDGLIPRYASLIYNGFWFSPEMKLLQETMDATQENVWGRARLKLYKGSCQVVGRKSTRSLYQSEYATFEEDRVFDQSDADGFIKLLGLRLRLQASLGKKE